MLPQPPEKSTHYVAEGEWDLLGNLGAGSGVGGTESHIRLVAGVGFAKKLHFIFPSRLKNMLLAFMMARGLKKLEGDKAAIGMQSNSATSLVVDDPLQIGERFLENSIRFTKTELQEIVYQLAEGELRRRLEITLRGEDWEINNSAVRFAIVNSAVVSGARLVKGSHVRLR